MKERLELTVTIDFGSTFTKVAAFDLNAERLIAVAQSKTTVSTDITNGLNKALEELDKTISPVKYSITRMMASSSAAGGLKMAAIGLTKALTTKAAQEAVLGAGAKLNGTYSFRLNPEDLVEIEGKAPDIILLAGGTDGGNEKNILYNAHMLSNSRIKAPIIIAGNRNACQQVESILKIKGKQCLSTKNIMPELDTLNIQPTQTIIRELFIKQITNAKGLNRARSLTGDIIMPTPSAVLKAAELLSKGTSEEPGIGDLLLVDIGGATIDIHSVGAGLPSDVSTILKGLPEPLEKRTVEGDLGIRFNADSILEHIGIGALVSKIVDVDGEAPTSATIDEYIGKITQNVEYIPAHAKESVIDTCLASKALEIASYRHAGTIESMNSPTGSYKVQRGKDLTKFPTIIGTGGILAKSTAPETILKATLYNHHYPEKLLPVSPLVSLDSNYILHSIGLLESLSSSKALRIIKKSLSNCPPFKN